MEEQEFNTINMIPLVDVMLVLLTIVLTTSTFIAMGVIPVELPKVSEARKQAFKSHTVEIDKKGNIYWDTRPVSAEVLRTTLGKIDRKSPILIRADRNIALQVFVDVLDLLKSLEFRELSLHTEEVG